MHHDPTITSDRTRSGRARVSSCAIAPPIEKPITCAEEMPSASQTPAASAAMSRTVNGPSGRVEEPTPRLSITVTRYRSANTGVWPSQAAPSSPRPHRRSTSSPAPSCRTCSRAPFTSTVGMPRT